MKTHVLSHKKRTLFWIISGTEVVGIFIMIGLLTYKKYSAPQPAVVKPVIINADIPASPARPVRPVKVDQPSPAAAAKAEPLAVAPTAPVTTQTSQPQETPVNDGEAQDASDLDRGEQGSAWQIYEQETANTPNSAASGPPLPKVIKNPKIVITKSKQILEVYDGSKLLRTYQASTGTNPGDKVKSGDRKTPEGEFYVCVKNPKSRFVLSLGLSYPSYEDARRGLHDGLITQGQHDHIISELNLKRQPPWNTKLGGEIMIHGVRQGGRSTAGCIALENDDIREIYPRIPVGTKVIVKP